MNEKVTLPCAVVRDVLPLYCDGVVSAETRSAVGEHLMDCEGCRREYEALREALPGTPEKDKSTLARFRAMMKRQRWKRIIAIAAAVVLAAAVTAGAIAALN